MKKKLLIGIISLLASVSAWADPVSLAKAKELAAPFLTEGTEARLVKKAMRNENKARKVASAVQTTSPYYIFSRGENRGFVIVSGDDCLPTILGYTDSGDFVEEKMPPALLGWLDYYSRIIEDAQVAGENVSQAKRRAAAPMLGATTAKVDVPVLMTSHWHQTAPYFNRCPYLDNGNHAVTGCVATAGSQVIYYYRKDNPSTLGASTPTYDYGAPVKESIPKGTPMKWNLMLDDYNSNCPQEYKDAVAEFCFAVGAATWLTYGESTGGYINNLVNTFSSGYNLSSVNVTKSSYSQLAWEKMIYDDLVEGHPMVYSGYNVDEAGTWNGHAVVVDGYRASSNLFHFNFGWGGQGDGWYTVNDETGMNGFNTEQSMTYKVQPKKQNLAAKVELPDGFYVNHDNTVKVTVENKGTLNYSGIYLFCSTTNTKPSGVASARSKDTETIIPNNGEKTVIKLSAKPTSDRKWYVKVTDKNMNVLAEIALKPEIITHDLQFNSLEVLSSSDVESHQGKDYFVVYSDRTTAIANLRNWSYVKYQGTPRLELYKSKDDGQTFEYVGMKSAVGAEIPAWASGEIEFSLTNTSSCPLGTDTLYYIALRNPLETIGASAVKYETGADTVARFVLRSNDVGLSATLDGKTLRFEGKWNASQFLTLCNRTANADALNYDLTKVEAVGRIPALEKKPNAIFYVADDSKASGKNVVKATASTADEMNIQMGYDFEPTAAIFAKKAVFNLDLTPNQWEMLTVPFAAAVPQGIVAKQVDAHTSTGIGNKTSIVRSFEAGKTYIVMASSKKNQVLTAADVTVVAAPVENVDTAVVGVFSTTTLPEGSLYLDEEDPQYFQLMEEGMTIPAFSGYFSASNLIRAFRANSNITLDPVYLLLGQAIEEANEVLEEYKSIMDAEAREALLAKIYESEMYFSEREGTSTKEVHVVIDALTESITWAKQQLRDDIHDMVVEMTDYIVNPSFEKGTTSTSTVGSITGWTPNGSGVSARSASNVYYQGVGADGNYLCYSYISTDLSGKGISQEITDMQPGLYRLTAKLGTDEGETVTLFANEQDTVVAAHDFGKYYLADASIDSIVVKAGDTLTIGVRDGHWFKADDFRLFYLRALNAEEDPLAIETLTATNLYSFTAVPVQGGVRITAPTAQNISIHSVSGTQVFRKVVFGTQTVRLPQGVYIVGGKKVLVK